MTRILKQTDTPTFEQVMAMCDNDEAGTIYQDNQMACFWCVRCNDVCYIGIDGIGMRGNYPQSAATWGEEFCRQLSDARRRCTDLSNWGIFDKDTYETVKRNMLPIESLTPKQLKLWKKLRRVMKGYKNVSFEEPAQKNMQFGVELELESDKYIDSTEKLKLSRKYKDLIQDVGDDGSVVNGAEIRFRHPTMRGWKLDTVKRVLDDAKELGLKSEWGTAGMHIHISCPNIKKATTKFVNNLFTMQNILYPINARNKMIGKGKKSPITYGVGSNIYHDQTNTFGTLEIRAWNATTNPEVFMARIRIAKAIVQFLLSNQKVTMENFFKWLPKSKRKDYLFLMNTENPNEFGLNQETILAMMK